MKNLTYEYTEVKKGWAVWFIQPDKQFLYSKTFNTREEAREYWEYKTDKNPKYKVVKVEETIITKVIK